jgi:hypothetical protein
MHKIFPITTRLILLILSVFIYSCSDNTQTNEPKKSGIHTQTGRSGGEDNGVTFHCDSTDYTRIFKFTGEPQKFVAVLSGDSITVTAYNGGAIGVTEIPTGGNKVIWHQANGDRTYAIDLIAYSEAVLRRVYPD